MSLWSEEFFSEFLTLLLCFWGSCTGQWPHFLYWACVRLVQWSPLTIASYLFHQGDFETVHVCWTGSSLYENCRPALNPCPQISWCHSLPSLCRWLVKRVHWQCTFCSLWSTYDHKIYSHDAKICKQKMPSTFGWSNLCLVLWLQVFQDQNCPSNTQERCSSRWGHLLSIATKMGWTTHASGMTSLLDPACRHLRMWISTWLAGKQICGIVYVDMFP